MNLLTLKAAQLLYSTHTSHKQSLNLQQQQETDWAPSPAVFRGGREIFVQWVLCFITGLFYRFINWFMDYRCYNTINLFPYIWIILSLLHCTWSLISVSLVVSICSKVMLIFQSIKKYYLFYYVSIIYY